MVAGAEEGETGLGGARTRGASAGTVVVGTVVGVGWVEMAGKAMALELDELVELKPICAIAA